MAKVREPIGRTSAWLESGAKATLLPDRRPEAHVRRRRRFASRVKMRAMPDDPTPLWSPSEERVEQASVTRFAREHDLPDDYGELWRWSVDDVERFWAAIWDFFDVQS